MKLQKIMYILVPSLGLMLMGACRKAPAKQEPRLAGIEFRDTVHHFGTVSLEQPVDSFDFEFTNTGKGPLVVLGVNTSCHCTRATYEQRPIEPGARSYIRVIYDGTGRTPEYFNKSVRVYTNAGDACISLRIDGRLAKPGAD